MRLAHDETAGLDDHRPAEKGGAGQGCGRAHGQRPAPKPRHPFDRRRGGVLDPQHTMRGLWLEDQRLTFRDDLAAPRRAPARPWCACA